MKELRLNLNQLSGTPPFAHIAWFGSTSLPLAHNELPKLVVVVVVVVVAAVQVVLQVALQVLVHAKICTDALSVLYPPGAQIKRGSRCS